MKQKLILLTALCLSWTMLVGHHLAAAVESTSGAILAPSGSEDGYGDYEAAEIQLGVPRATLQLMDELDDEIGDLQRRGPQEAPRRWAGLWQDYEDGGSVSMAFVGGPPPGFAKAFSRGDLIRFVAAEYSLRELQTVEGKIARDIDGLRESGIDIASVGLDLPLNRVLVGIVEPHVGIEEALQKKYGGAIAVLPQEWYEMAQLEQCTSRQSCVPRLRGGLEIIMPEVNSMCSSGLEATRGSFSVMITAGHCVAGGTGTRVFHSGAYVGESVARMNSNNTDAAAIGRDAFVWQSSNQVYATETNKTYAINSIRLEADERVGYAVCKAGRSSGYTCGQITRLNVLACDQTSCLSGQTETNACALPGDSGGAMVWGGRALGVASRASFNRDNQNQPTCTPGYGRPISTYAPIERVQTRLGVTVRTRMP